MKNNNKGFSLVELLVVVAILSVLAVGTTLSYRAVRSADVRKAASTFEEMMKSVRTECMGKAETHYLYVYKESDGYYYVISSTKSSSLTQIKSMSGVQKLCAKSIDISCETESGSDSITTGTYVTIYFEKGTGKVKYSCNGTDGGNLTGVVVKRGSKTSNVIVAYETGKTSVHK